MLSPVAGVDVPGVEGVEGVDATGVGSSFDPSSSDSVFEGASIIAQGSTGFSPNVSTM